MSGKGGKGFSDDRWKDEMLVKVVQPLSLMLEGGITLLSGEACGVNHGLYCCRCRSEKVLGDPLAEPDR